jgi:hypothetical protein
MDVSVVLNLNDRERLSSFPSNSRSFLSFRVDGTFCRRSHIGKSMPGAMMRPITDHFL